MNEHRYVIVSGYHADFKSDWQPWFFNLWWHHNINPLKGCHRSYVIATQDSLRVHTIAVPLAVELISVPGDLGKCMDVLTGRKPYFCPGVVAVWLAGAWLAYASECDLIYLEQDCLCFGPWVDQMYVDLGGKNVVFGTGKSHGGVSTSIFLMKHDFIPRWCRDYLAEGYENAPSRIPEHKMRRIREREPEEYAALSFGYDTDRPFNATDPVFYVQKTTPAELRQLSDAGRLTLPEGEMPDVDCFTNK